MNEDKQYAKHRHIYSAFIQSNKGHEPLNGKLSRMGRCWWYWIPTFNWNGGLPFRDRCSDFSFKLFCYCWTITFYWK